MNFKFSTRNSQITAHKNNWHIYQFANLLIEKFTIFAKKMEQ